MQVIMTAIPVCKHYTSQKFEGTLEGMVLTTFGWHLERLALPSYFVVMAKVTKGSSTNSF